MNGSLLRLDLDMVEEGGEEELRRKGRLKVSKGRRTGWAVIERPGE